MENICPVCGYKGLYEPPWTDKEISSLEICPCCGIQFGYDDAAGGDERLREEIYSEWRKKWIDDGMKWFSRGRKEPENWDPKKQLKNIGKSIP